MTININKQTDLNLENQIKLLCKVSRYSKKEQHQQDKITACYERLSQEDRNEGESNSIANQRKILEGYCKSHGYENIRHYDEDDGFSGTNFQRPGFQRMLADIKAGEIARVIVKDMSRLGRDYLQVGMYTDIVFQEYGVHFIAINDGVDSKRGDNEFTAIRNVFNEMFARDTSKKIRATFQNKGKSGEKLNVIPPFGYLKDPNNKKTWLVDEKAADVVRMIFNLCVEGKGPAQIAKHLQQQLILSPAAHHKQQGTPTNGRLAKDPYKWSCSAVSKILERLDYLGHTVNFKTSVKSFKDRKTLQNDPEKWAVFENAHPAIIDESVFEIVQNLRKARKRPTRQGEMGLFSGLVFCKDCGAKMYLSRANTSKSQVEYYICSNYRNHRELCDSSHQIRSAVLGEIILQNLREAITYVSRHEGDFIREAAEIAAQTHDKGLVADKEAIRKAEKRIGELDTIIKKLYEDNVTGKLTDERFMKFSRDYEIEQEKLETSIEAMRNEVSQKAQKRINTKSFTAAAKKYTDLKELDGAVLRELISRIEISATPKYSKKHPRVIGIEYNFIGDFDFNAASESAEAVQPQKKTA
ncbi:MAG: recombinase family protein [Oscillospiraceae bacterium]|nr:recombinase family protein [Oscillospiraceae bacterium]